MVCYEGEDVRGKAVRGRTRETSGRRQRNQEANLQDRELVSFREQVWGAEEKLDFFSSVITTWDQNCHPPLPLRGGKKELWSWKVKTVSY